MRQGKRGFMKFTATYVESNTNTATANVMFADPVTNPDQPSVLMFSRSIEFHESAYYFEINDQSCGSYGGLALVQISRNSIKVHLEPSMVKDFGDENLAQVQVDFNIDDKTYQSVLDALCYIFANDKVLVVEAIK
jgi:hypothetical protein